MIRNPIRLLAFATSVALLLIGSVLASAGAHATTNGDHGSQGKVFVCKYVGKPGTDEQLQTGQNPIDVSVNAIKDYQGIGSWFNDAQGRSYVLAEDVGQPEPSVSECPPPDGPPTTTPPPTTEPPTSDSPSTEPPTSDSSTPTDTPTTSDPATDPVTVTDPPSSTTHGAPSTTSTSSTNTSTTTVSHSGIHKPPTHHKKHPRRNVSKRLANTGVRTGTLLFIAFALIAMGVLLLVSPKLATTIRKH